jgi:hypothetical protein
MSTAGGVLVPTFQPEDVPHRRRIATWATEVNKGHINNTGTLTLGAATVSTIVVDSRVGPFSFIGMMPLTAKALSAEPTVYVSSQAKGTFTLAHSSTVSTTKTFRYCILG